MARDLVNEQSAFTLRVRFRDETNALAVPLSARYILRDVTNCRTIIGWTILPTDSEVFITIDADDNAIHQRCNCSEERALSVQANYGQSSQFASEYRYVIENLRGFES